jgi:hypothetical protein
MGKLNDEIDSIIKDYRGELTPEEQSLADSIFEKNIIEEENLAKSSSNNEPVKKPELDTKPRKPIEDINIDIIGLRPRIEQVRSMKLQE